MGSIKDRKLSALWRRRSNGAQTVGATWRLTSEVCSPQFQDLKKVFCSCDPAVLESKPFSIKIVMEMIDLLLVAIETDLNIGHVCRKWYVALYYWDPRERCSGR